MFECNHACFPLSDSLEIETQGGKARRDLVLSAKASYDGKSDLNSNGATGATPDDNDSDDYENPPTTSRPV